jgi:multidrug transporter EmrE-like cation transporter
MHNAEVDTNKRQSDIEKEERYKRNQKKKLIRLIYIFVPLAILLIAGIVLYAVGQETHSLPLMIAGGVVTGVGFVPIVIISIVLWFKQGFVR